MEKFSLEYLANLEINQPIGILFKERRINQLKVAYESQNN